MTAKDMPFGFGLHPAFKLDDEFSTYTLAFEKEENVRNNCCLILATKRM